MSGEQWIGCGLLAVAAWRWWPLWRARRPVGPGERTSTCGITLAALCGSMLTAEAAAPVLAAVVAAPAALLPAGLLDVAPTVVTLAVAATAVEVGCRGIGLAPRYARPRLAHAPLAVLLPVVAVAAWPLIAHTIADLRAAPAEATAEAAASAAPGPADPEQVADIPPEYLLLYRQAGSTCAGLDWALLAGVGKVETDHGRARLPGVTSGTNYAGAGGPMQFLGPTWQEVRSKHPEVGPDIYNPEHAIPAAAHYLCDGGLIDGRGVRAALWTYNRSVPYADRVLGHADRYRAEDAAR